MNRFLIAVSIEQESELAAAHCAGRLGAGHTNAAAAIGFLYLTDHFAQDFARIRCRLQAATGVAHWVGSIGTGVIANDGKHDPFELNDQPAVVAAVAPMPAGSFRLVDQLDLEAPAPEPAPRLAESAYPFGIVHVDPNPPAAMEEINELAVRSGGFLVGGLVSSRRPLPTHAPPFAGRAVSGVMFDATVPVQTGLTQGCSPLGPTRVITEGQDHLIMSIDGRPALDVFREDIGELLARDLKRVGNYVHVAFPLADSDRRDYLVRNLIGIDPMRRWLAVGEHVASGERLMFVRRDPASARTDLEGMLRSLSRRLDAPPRGAVYFTCVARGENMFGRAGEELAIIRQELGPIPLAGFACGGEICNGRVYGYTGVLAVFT
jgi:Uncharacterized protein conserved in bacteria